MISNGIAGEFLKAFNISDCNLKRITITFECDSLVTIETERFIDKKDLTKATEIMTKRFKLVEAVDA